MDKTEKIKNDLDSQLEDASPNVGIAFGIELFDEFKQRKWFTLESFSVLGTGLFSGEVPTYRKSHFVFQSWGIGDYDFEVGKSE